ncbi:hypothetical protein [Shewanella sp. HN-41]|uniref:hypothetical protein n=1 Tax=Shewanella sp. HN-41 TaxID=327275 RepID=UPI0002126722|nr:hypothetical protein [Shewanella sp. HN-41]EGM70205.1 hypothetical protein SOHN41_01799 [Shewanella sp. HN-41]
MDRAYNKVTNEILYAHQVKNQGDEYVAKHKNNFECPNLRCNGTAEPIACFSKRQISPSQFQPYKQLAHFRIKNHIPNCIFSEEYGGKGGTDANGNYSWVLPYVTEINLPSSNEQKLDKLVEKTPNLATAAKASKVTRHTNGAANERKVQRSSSISAAVFYYIQSPEQAKNKNLKILGYTRTYQHYFQEIGGFKNSRYIDNHIFYKPLKFTHKPVVIDDIIVVTLYQIDPRSGKLFELHLNTANWTSRDKEACLFELEMAINAAKNKSEFTTVFFVGHQDRTQNHVFHCNYSEFFCVYVGEKFSLPNNHRGMMKIQQQVDFKSEFIVEQTVEEPSLQSKNFQTTFINSAVSDPKLYVETTVRATNTHSTADTDKNLNTSAADKPTSKILKENQEKPAFTSRVGDQTMQRKVYRVDQQTQSQKPIKHGVLSTIKTKLKYILGL